MDREEEEGSPAAAAPPSQNYPLAYEEPAPDRAASAGTTTEDLLESQPHDPYSAWRHRDFSLFSIGWGTALIGLQIQSTAVGWEIYKHTGRAMDLGWIGLVQAIPILALALPAGYVADHYDRRKVVMLTQGISCLCSAALAVISYLLARGQINFAWLYLPLFI